MKHYPVLAEFEDVHTGNRHAAGGTFATRDEAQLTRLQGAGCLGKKPTSATDKPIGDMSRAELENAAVEHFSSQLSNASDDDLRSGLERARQAAEDEDEGKGPVDPAEIARQQLNEDGLFERTLPELKELAEAEKIDLGTTTKKADIIAAIRAARAA